MRIFHINHRDFIVQGSDLYRSYIPKCGSALRDKSVSMHCRTKEALAQGTGQDCGMTIADSHSSKAYAISLKEKY